MGFEEFAAARLPALLRYAVLLTGDRDGARDVVQEALARALVRWRRIEAMEEPYAYVRKIVTNEYLAGRRRRRPQTVPLDPDGPALPDPTSAVDDREHLWRLLATLPHQQRAVLVLRYYEGLADLEIADVLGCRPGTVRGYASRALATLRIDLGDLATSKGSAK